MCEYIIECPCGQRRQCRGLECGFEDLCREEKHLQEHLFSLLLLTLAEHHQPLIVTDPFCQLEVTMLFPLQLQEGLHQVFAFLF